MKSANAIADLLEPLNEFLSAGKYWSGNGRYS